MESLFGVFAYLLFDQREPDLAIGYVTLYHFLPAVGHCEMACFVDRQHWGRGYGQKSLVGAGFSQELVIQREKHTPGHPLEDVALWGLVREGLASV
ncbi:MAG: hypothetical protein AAFO69_05330, partial [Bacteroidota bacterium]